MLYDHQYFSTRNDETANNLVKANGETSDILEVIRTLCEKQPLILIWEDLHWFDSESLEFVDGLLRDPPSHALLMLLTGREERPSWRSSLASERRASGA